MIHRHLLPLVALPFLLGASDPGCGSSGSDLPDNFDESYEWRESGCADVTIYASADDDTIGIIFMAQGMDYVADAQAAGVETTYTIDFSQEADVALEVWEGTRVTAPVCNDVVTDETKIKSTYTATSGAGTLTITPDPDATEEWDINATGRLYLEGIEFRDDKGNVTQMDDFGPLEVAVGWLPG